MLSAVGIAIYVAQYGALSAAFSMGCKISGDSGLAFRAMDPALMTVAKYVSRDLRISALKGVHYCVF